MNGSIKKRSKHSWTIVVDVPRGTDGKRHQKSIAVRGTKRDAEARRAQLLNEINIGAYIDPTNLNVAVFLGKWLDIYAGSVSGKTHERAAGIVKNHLVPALGSISLEKLKQLHIQRYYIEAAATGRRDGKGGLAKGTIRFHHAILHRALADAVKWEILRRNPASLAAPPKADKCVVATLTAQEVIQLLFVSRGTTWEIPVLLAATTGMRRGEILALRWEDVDIAAGTLCVRRTLEQTRTSLTFKEPKTPRSIRMIALLPLTIAALVSHKQAQAAARLPLVDYYEDNDLVYCQADGTPIKPNSISSNFCVLLEKAGLGKRRFHDLRHTHATLLLERGVHPKVVQERMGHSSISMTMDTYSHVMPTMQRDAANRLQEFLEKL